MLQDLFMLQNNNLRVKALVFRCSAVSGCLFLHNREVHDNCGNKMADRCKPFVADEGNH